MKPLYTSAPVRETLGRRLKPGGLALTERVLALTNPGLRARIVDAGCGAGATLSLLHARGYERVVGIDLDAALLAECKDGKQPLVQSDIARMPLGTGCCDVILCECVFNLTEKERVLAECARVLRPGGLLAIVDIYSRATASTGAAWPVRCCFAAATDLATVQKQVIAAGFALLCLEDHTRQLRQTAAEFVFAYGSRHGFWEAVTGDAGLAEAACDATAAVRPGFFLLIAKRLEL